MLDLNRRPAPLRPDTAFVLYVNAFTHRVDGGYQASVFEGKLSKLGDTLAAHDALAFLARFPHTVVDVLHV